MTERLNRLLDGLARTRIGEQSAFLAMGTAGFYGALAVTVAAGLVMGRSLAVLLLLTATSVASFFAYLRIRKLITGCEQMVQQHQVWLALLAGTATLILLKQPVRPFLDIICAGLAVFLTGGRLGCLMVGCCFGRPSSLGIRYGQEHSIEGFPPHLVGVRLFPVQGLELLGLASIALTSLIALPFAPAGVVLCWFLFTHALLRFAVDPLRWDSRNEVLGLSRARWRSVVQMVVAIAIADARIGVREGVGAAVVVLALACCLARRVARDPRRRVLSPRHLEEMRAIASVLSVEVLTAMPGSPPVTRRSSTGLTVAASMHTDSEAGVIHLSLANRPGHRDLRLLCDLASEVFPGLEPQRACASTHGVLHLLVEPTGTGNGSGQGHTALADQLYSSILTPAVPDSPARSRRVAIGPGYFTSVRTSR